MPTRKKSAATPQEPTRIGRELSPEFHAIDGDVFVVGRADPSPKKPAPTRVRVLRDVATVPKRGKSRTAVVQN